MKSNLVLNGELITLEVEGIQIHKTGFGVHCAGFDAVTLGDCMTFHSFSDLLDSIPRTWEKDVCEELHALAAEAFDEQEQAKRSLESDYRAWRAS